MANGAESGEGGMLTRKEATKRLEEKMRSVQSHDLTGEIQPKNRKIILGGNPLDWFRIASFDTIHCMDLGERLRGKEQGNLQMKAFVLNELEGPRLLGEEVTKIEDKQFLRVKERLPGGISTNYYKATEKSVREQAEIEDKLKDKGFTSIDNAMYLDKIYLGEANDLRKKNYKEVDLDLT